MLRQAPIRKIDFDNTAEVRIHDQLVSLAIEAETISVKLRSEANPTTQNRLETKFGALDERIDLAVGELYGLAPAEIRRLLQANLESY